MRRERNSGCLVLLLCFKLGLSSEVFVAIESLVEFSEEEEEDKEKLVTKDIGKEQHLCQIEKAAGGGLLGILEHGFFLKGVWIIIAYCLETGAASCTATAISPQDCNCHACLSNFYIHVQGVQ